MTENQGEFSGQSHGPDSHDHRGGDGQPQEQSLEALASCVTRITWVHVQEGFFHVTFPAGKADGTAVRELYELAARLAGTFHQRLVIDFTGTAYVPSGMMGMLVTVKKKIASAGGQVHVVVVDPLSMGAFTAMRLDRLLSLHKSLPEATAAFKP